MITVSIGGMSLPFDQASERWIAQMLEDARKRGASPCIQVRLRTSEVDVALSSPGCGGGVGGRQPTPREMRIVELWNKHHLNTAQVSPGDVRAFLAQVEGLV
jgi:hypothetical protein